jgi:hypothetical protein
MRHTVAVISLGILIALVGCDKGTSGGPGATTPPTASPMSGQVDDTFSLVVPSVKLAQGESKTVSIGISRGTNFSEDVSISLGELPTGVTADPGSPAIRAGDPETVVTVRAANDAALGDFKVKVTGKPTKGGVAEAEFNITVTELVVDTTASDAAAKAERDREILALEEQLAVYKQKYEGLKESAAEAMGEAKTELDAKVAAANEKIEAAQARLSEMKLANADNWERVKTAVANAYDDLKSMFD